MTAPAIAMLVARVLYLFAPVFVSAALSAVVHRYDLFAALAKPIDSGRSWRGKRIFGDGKTWRGVAIAVVASIATVCLQRWAVGARAGDLAFIDYESANPVLLGLAIGGGAMAGELPNSFVKRRLGIARGETSSTPLARALFWLWDQVDLVTGVWPLLAFWMPLRLDAFITSVVIAAVLHPAVAWIGFALGARRSAR